MAAGTIGVPELEGDIGSPGVSSAVHSVVAFYAPVDLDRELPPDAPSSLLLGDGAAAQARRAASPLACAASGRFPPTLLIHGTADPIINLDESLAMHSALRRAGVRSELQLFPGRAHDFDAEPRLARECAERVQSFLASSSGEAGNVGGSAGS